MANNKNYENIDNPYDVFLNRQFDLNNLEVSNNFDKIKDIEIFPKKVDLFSGNNISNDNKYQNIWFNGILRSRNYAPQATGVLIDSNKGKIECQDAIIETLEVDGSDINTVIIDIAKLTIYNKIADYTILATQATGLYGFANDGATDTITLTLPSAVTGLKVIVINVESQELRIKAASGDVIYTPTATGVSAIYNDIKGGLIELYSPNDSEWFSNLGSGIWNEKIYDIIFSCDATSDKIYKHSGFSSTISDSFSSPSTLPTGLTWDGINIYSIDGGLSGGTDKIYKHSGFSSTISDSFSSPSTTLTGITCDENNIYSCDKDSNKIYKHSGFSNTISDSFSTPDLWETGLTWDGINIYSSDNNTDKIRKYSGFSFTLLSSFNAPTITTKGVSWDGINIYSIGQFKIYKHSGFSTTISDSFSSPSSNITGIEYEDFNARIGA